MRNPPGSLLIVDDEVDSCRNLADIFNDLGYRVDTAHDGPGALEKLGEARYDIALLDLMMPGMDGVSLYHEMKRRRPEIVAVLTTAFPTHPRAEESLKTGMWRIVPKPMDLARLLTLVDEALNLPLVLLIDDDANLCANMWDLLRERGFRVCVAQDARTASEFLQDGGFKVVLIDMQISGDEGADVFRMVRQVEPRARTVLVGGHWAQLARSFASLRAEGADAICLKPFDLPALIAIVERLSRP